MTDSTLSNQIYLSRESIRAQISDEIKKYLELENVDLTKSSFLTFLVDIVSTLTGNVLFYQLSTYKEFFLTTAQLPSSIFNLSSFLGYNIKEATPSRVNVLMTIPFGFEDSLVNFIIPEGFTFNADEQVTFQTYYTINIEVTNNNNAKVIYTEGNKRFNIPVSYDDTLENFYFVLPLLQKETVVQELQIDSDIRPFQFVILDVPIDGQIADLQVQIKNPNDAGYTTWTEFSSVFLMNSTDKGYVSRPTETGRRLTFGNNLIGVQPDPGASVLVTATITKGSEGNVISGSIRSGERIYTTTLAGFNEIVNYTVINNSPAFGGEDEESLEEIRANSIESITMLERLVTENDYKNINLVLESTPIAQNSLPVLKRSDLQVNEIALFTSLIFGSGEELVDNIVPTRNVYHEVPLGTTSIPRGTIITVGDYDYYTLFDIEIESLNTVGEYYYILYEIELIPALETTFTSTYNLYSDRLEIIKDGSQGIYKLHYFSDEPDADLTTCEMVIQSSGAIKNMTNVNDATSSYFIFVIDPYTDIPSDEQTYEFTIYEPGGDPIVRYSNKATFRRNLETFMRSNVVDNTSIIVYDIPVVESTYYDSINKRDFELEVLQELTNTFDLSDRRMLTDFVNTKLTNTHGRLENIRHNPVTRSSVLDIVDTLPVVASLGDRYIFTGEGDNQDSIIRCTQEIPVEFSYDKPTIDSIVFVENQNQKYIYSERGWITMPLYNIPLNIEIEVFRDITFSGTLSQLVNTVRDTIYEAFKDRFGSNIAIYRSEIIDVVHTINGISHCRLRKPETSIFFNFELKTFEQEDLLRYGPEYVYFTKDNITVKVI